MNTINSKTRFIFRFFVFKLGFLLFFQLFSCVDRSTELKVINSQLCDNYDREASCIEPKDKIGDIELTHTNSKKELKSWEAFGNYLYFTARETPGFVLTFSRELTPSEVSSIKLNYSAYIRLDGIREKMEGFEISKNHIASFHYLGSLLKEVKRHRKEDQKKTDLEELGVLLLQFEYFLPSGETGTLQREVKLKWK